MRGIPRLFAKRTPTTDRFVACLLSASLLFGQAQPVFAAFGDGTPTIPNISVFTDPTQPSKVDGSTGSFTQKIPLDIPPGRNGLQPDVSLDYNSQRMSDGIVGYGWSLSVPYIERLNKTGSQNLYQDTPYFSSSIDGELALATTTTPASRPSIMDSLDLTEHGCTGCVSDSFQYHVPDGGSNKLFMVPLSRGGTAVATGTLNGVPLSTFTQINSNGQEAFSYYAYLANPPTGTSTFTLTTHSSGDGITYHVFTLQNAVQSNPIDGAPWQGYTSTHSSMSTSTTTSVGSDLLLSMMDDQGGGDFSSYGSGETQMWHHSSDPIFAIPFAGTWKTAAATPTAETMSENNNSVQFGDYQFIAVKAASSLSQGSLTGTSTAYLAKVDDGSFNSYNFYHNTWTVYDKKGTKYTYGSDDTGRMYGTTTGTSTRTSRWYLQEIRDTNDNYIKYTYLKDNNVLYPYTITYTGHGSSDGISTVSFATSTRPDVRLSYAGGFAATTTKRISEIDASVNGSIARKYLLGYGTGDNGYRSLLTSIQEQGYDDNNNLTSLPATTFTYSTTSTQFYAPSAKQADEGAAYAVADTDGDAINDLNVFMPGAGQGFDYVDGGFAISVPNASTPPPDYWALNTSPHTPEERGVRYIDVNGDGKADVVRGWIDDTTGTNDYAIYSNTYATTTDSYGWTATSTSFTGVVPTFAKKTSTGLYLTGGVFGDVNGDGLPDYATSLP